MFKNKLLSNQNVKKEFLSAEVKEQLDGLYAILEDRYGQGFADSIMKPYLSSYAQSLH